jgi:hypothetical protein
MADRWSSCEVWRVAVSGAGVRLFVVSAEGFASSMSPQNVARMLTPMARAMSGRTGWGQWLEVRFDSGAVFAPKLGRGP